MRLLFLTPAYYPALGGAETHVRCLAEALVACGHSVTLVADAGGAAVPPRDYLNGVEVRRTREYTAGILEPDREPWEECSFGLLREFERLLAGRHFDLIHAHGQVAILLAGMMKRNLDCKLVASAYETEPERDPMGASRSEFLFGHVPYDLLIAGSEFFRNLALRYHAPPERLRLVYMGVDLEHFHPGGSGRRIRGLLQVGADHRLVLLVGRFKERKGMREFVSAMARVIRQFPQARGLINGGHHAGSLAYLAEVEQLIRELGCERWVRVWRQPWNYDEMPELFAAADIVVQPSRAEGLGLALLEAMASARPAIASDVPGIREIITHGETGWLVPPQDPEPLAEAILYLLRQDGEAQRLGCNGHRRVQERFSLRRMVAQTVDAYRSTLT